MMHRFFLKRLRDLSRALLIPTGILFLCIMLITGASQLRDVLDTTAASTANLEQTLGCAFELSRVSLDRLNVVPQGPRGLFGLGER